MAGIFVGLYLKEEEKKAIDHWHDGLMLLSKYWTFLNGFNLANVK